MKEAVETLQVIFPVSLQTTAGPVPSLNYSLLFPCSLRASWFLHRSVCTTLGLFPKNDFSWSSALQYDDLLPSLEAAGQIIYHRSDPAVWIVYLLAQHRGWQWCSVIVSLKSLLPNIRCWAVRTMTWFSHMQLHLLASDQIFIHMYVFYSEQMQYVQILKVGHI